MIINLSHDFVRPLGVDSALWTLQYIVGINKREIAKQAKVGYNALHRPTISPATRSSIISLLIKYSDIIEKQRVVGGNIKMNKALRTLNTARAKFINFVIEEIVD